MIKTSIPHFFPWRVCVESIFVIALIGCASPIPAAPSPTVTATPTPHPTQTATPTVTPTPSVTPGPSLDELLTTPNALAAAAHLDDAMVYYGDLATLYPASAEPLLRMAALAQRQNDAEAAERYFEAAAKADPTHRDALRLWAIFLDSQGRYADLVGVYDRMAALGPDNADLRVARAMANARLGKAPAAADDLAAAMALDPNREYAWLNVAGAASGGRQYEAAIEIASAGLDAYPDSSGLLMTRGLATLSTHDTDAAIADFKAVEALDPSNAMALHWHGRALIESGSFSEAVETLQRAAELGALSGADGVNLSYESMAYAADALARTDVNAAFEYLAARVFQHGSRDGLMMGYGLARWRQGNISLAVGRMNSLVDIGFVPALHWRGAILAEQGETEKAIADLKAFLSLRHSGPDVESARETLESLGVDPDKP